MSCAATYRLPIAPPRLDRGAVLLHELAVNSSASAIRSEGAGSLALDYHFILLNSAPAWHGMALFPQKENQHD
jgi:hypothetical protein